jgi:hypothetical protein
MWNEYLLIVFPFKYTVQKLFQYLYLNGLVSIVSSNGLEDRAIQVRSLAEAKDFSSNL